MKLELHGVIAIVALITGVTLAAIAARSHQWPLGLASGALLSYSIIAALIVLRRVRAMMNGPPLSRPVARSDVDQSEPGATQVD